MKIANDIRALIEDDVKRLTEAFMTGEIPFPKGTDPAESAPSELHAFAADIIRYQLENRMLSLVLPYLSTMRWLTFQEACIYARKSRNTMLGLMKEGKIYATKADGGERIVDRESIDAYYNTEREVLREKLRELRRRAS